MIAVHLRLAMRDLCIESAGHDDHQVGLRGGVPLPGLLLRLLTDEAEHILAAGVVDQLRGPVAGDIGRIEPLERDHPRSPRAPHGQPDPIDSGRGLTDQIHGSVLGVCGLCDRSGIAQDLSHSVRIERDHQRLAVDLLGDLPDVLVGDGADLAQRLGDDQVGLEVLEHLGVELVDRFAAERELLDGRVDLRRRESGGKLVSRHSRERRGRRRVVALMGDGDDVVPEAEREHHLGRGGNQAYDAHTRSKI